MAKERWHGESAFRALGVCLDIGREHLEELDQEIAGTTDVVRLAALHCEHKGVMRMMDSISALDPDAVRQVTGKRQRGG